MDFVTTTGNVIFDLLHNFHLECGARLHKLRVYETLTDPTGREVCGYLLVRGGVHAHAYALALKNLTGVEIEKMLPTPNINLSDIPECQKYLDEGSHRRLYTFSPEDYAEIAGIWGNGEMALPDDPPGELEVVEGMPDGGKIPELEGTPSAFTPDYAPEDVHVRLNCNNLVSNRVATTCRIRKLLILLTIHKMRMFSTPRQTGKFFDSRSNHRQFNGQQQTTDVEESSRRT